MGVRQLLLIVAVVCFVLAALPVGIGLNLIAIGLAAGFGSFLAS